MNSRHRTLLCSALFLSALHAAPSAADIDGETGSGTLTITPDRVDESLHDSTADVTVVTAEEIRQRGYQSLSDAVSRIGGFVAASNGGPGQSSGLFLRGMNSGNILILLDGVPLKDPTDPSFSAGLAHVRLDEVARIEVVKGAQSGIWGADAAAGVINIITRNPAPGTHVDLRAEAGSYRSSGAGATFSADSEAGGLIFGADHFHTGGFSARLPREAEKDGYTNDTLHFKGRLALSADSQIGLFYHDISGAFGYDSANPDDAGSNGSFKEKILGGNWRYRTRKLRVNAMMSLNTIDRHIDDANWGASDYHGRAERAAIAAAYDLDSSQRISGGIDYNRYTGDSTYQPESSFDNRGYWAAYRYIADDLLGARTVLNATLRYDDFNTFTNKTTYRFGFRRSCRLLPGFFTAGNLYSAYRAPSLYEYGTNKELKPESTRGFDLSAGYKKLLKLSYFRNKIRDRIDYDFGTWSYFNAPDDYTLDGIEIEGSYAFAKFHTVLSANFTHMFSLKDEQGHHVLRVPRNAGNLFFDYYYEPNIHIGLNLQYVGKRVDYGNVRLGGYTLINLGYDQKIGHNLSVSLRLHNLLDKKYENLAGYATEGRSIYAKIRYRF